ncbi:MAG: carotenoid biosynthesis protein [Bacteroidetes bacterium]|nr:carotenoid biosynthesis protein [Bacteroidota bacterium]
MEVKLFRSENRPKTFSGILIILYFVGVVSLLTNLHPDFILLTPVNLLISLILILWNHKEWSTGFVVFLAGTWCWGFFAEMIGVQTGMIFGDYAYGVVLGPKVNGTPLMIGVNWMMLAYAGGICLNHIAPKMHWFFRGLGAALLLVGLDILIEPVAIAYGFWSWGDSIPPLQNYIGWFLVALPLQLVFARFFGESRNIVAMILFILQIAFFSILGLTA